MISKILDFIVILDSTSLALFLFIYFYVAQGLLSIPFRDSILPLHTYIVIFTSVKSVSLSLAFSSHILLRDEQTIY